VRVSSASPTSANSAGFDALGLALTLYNEVGASEAEGVSVAIEARAHRLRGALTTSSRVA